MREQFEKLVKELCALVKLPDAKHVIDGGTVDVNGTTVGLIFNEQVASDRCFIYAEYGVPPLENQAQAYQALLLHNFMDFTGKGPCFTVSPFTGQVVYIEDILLASAKADDLGANLTGIAAKAADWRATQFLKGEHMLKFERVPTGLKLAGHA